AHLRERGSRPVQPAAGGRAAVGPGRVPGGPPGTRRLRRRAAAAGRDGHDRARRGRQDARHRRPVRRHEGVLRRPVPARGGQPRRGARPRGEDPGRADGRRDRGSPAGGEVALLEQVFRDEWGRVLAGLIGFLGDFDLAEEAAQEAFAIAAERWPQTGVPEHPGAWLATTARNRAIDRIRRDRTLAAKTRLLEVPEAVEDELDGLDGTVFPDERLALEAQVALTLRSLGGLTTEEIARAFLVSDETMKRRLTRAKTKIKTAGIP